MRNTSIPQHLLSKCPWTMFVSQHHKCWAAPRSIINQKLCSKMHDTCSGRSRISWFLFAEYLRNKKKKTGCHPKLCVPPRVMLLWLTGLPNSGVWVGTVVVVREAVSRDKCLGRYSCNCGIILYQKTFKLLKKKRGNGESLSNNKQLDSAGLRN